MATLTKSWTYLGQRYIGTSGGDLYVRLYARYTQQDVANNRTYVEYNASTYYVNSTYIQDLAGVIGCSGTGTAWKQTACTYVTTGEKGWVTNGAWVTHKNDGTKSVSATAKLTFPNWGWSEEVTATASLPTIPRASQPSINTHPISVKEITIGESVTIHMNRKANFTHKVTASFGEKTELITESCTDNVTWDGFTVEKFASEIPNSASGVLTITVDTFNGQTLIGTKSAQVTATLPLTVIPTIQSLSASAVSDSVPTAWNLYVQSKSKCKITVNNALGVHGSTIKSYLIKEGNTIVANADTGTTVLFADAGTHTFTATVTDSRGRTASKEISINVEPYELPTIQAVLSQRCLQDGTLNEDGTYARCLSLFSISSCGGKNVANAKVYYKKTDESVWSSGTPFTSNVAITIGNGLIDADFAYDLKYELTDSLTAEPTIIYDMVSTSFSTMDYKKGGRGIAIGKASEKLNTFEINSSWDFYVHGKELIDLIYPVGSIYMSVNDVSPQVLFGGTWERWGNGRVPVGVDATQTDFDVVEKTGGEKTHILTTDEMPDHRHDVFNDNSGGYLTVTSGYGIAFTKQPPFKSYGANINMSNAGKNQPHNNLQPYITCYMWKRTK